MGNASCPKAIQKPPHRRHPRLDNLCNIRPNRSHIVLNGDFMKPNTRLLLVTLWIWINLISCIALNWKYL